MLKDNSGRECFYLDVGSCARCGEDHQHVLFTKFTSPPDEEVTHFGSCPKLGEPILMIVSNTSGQ